MRRLLAIPLLALAAIQALAADSLTVMWTGETHAMLEPCVCPLRPEGGLARRATVLASARATGNAIIVDAGGWAAGGLYDEYTEGAVVDARRTETTARSMALMGYDAVAISDEELAADGKFLRRLLKDAALPFVSANLVDKTSREPVAPAYRLVQRGSWRVGIIGLTTPKSSAIGSVSEQFNVLPPIGAARRAVSTLRANGVDLVMVLSPLGEEMSERLAREVDGIDLIVNSHRRSTAAPWFKAGKTTVVQFSFQGRSVGKAAVRRSAGGAGRHAVEPADPVVLGPKVADEKQVAAIVSKALEEIKKDASSRVLSIELFKMSQCPYSPPVEKHIAELRRAFGKRAAARVTQLVHIDARGRLSSLHGQGELDEARRQAAIAEFYPDKYFDYAAWRNANPTEDDWLGKCRSLGMSAARLRGCVVSGEADEILKRHAKRCERLRVSGSPTIYFGGRRYMGGVSKLELMRAACSTLPGGVAGIDTCKGLPACFADVDCRKAGFVGECKNPGTKKARCVEHKAVPVSMTIIEDSRAVHSAAKRVVESLRAFFPGLSERKVDYRSAEGASLVAKYKIERLPAYILDKVALKERGIDAVRKALVPTADALVLSAHLAGSHQDITRVRREGRVDMFLAPHATGAADALTEFLDMRKRDEAPPTVLRSMVWRNAEGRLAAQGGMAELESMLREAAVGLGWRRELHPYLRARLKRIGSSYWQDPLVEVGLVPAEVRRRAEDDLSLALLDADAQELAEIAAGGPVVIVVGNQEVVPCASRADVRHTLAAARALAEREGVLSKRAPSRADDAPQLLVRALKVVPDAARSRIAAGLKALTGLDLGTDHDAWRRAVRP